MCKRVLACLAVLSAVLVLLALGAPAANAQSSGHLKAIVPFDFMAGTKSLPPGVYFVTRDAGPVAAIHLENSERPLALLVNIPPPASSMSGEPSRLVFQQYGQHYFLREVWFRSNTGRALPQTNEERIFAQEYFSASQRGVVSIVASLQ